MDRRSDAMLSAARLITAVDEIAKKPVRRAFHSWSHCLYTRFRENTVAGNCRFER
ncbi:MAG: hypothetical protein Ct9H300mP26_4280 [Acidimicrobiales bacterium]|nr:MAG: hypothetical protein Ct9H300mP26_4280 [Acidimicrobiales bacterium]